MTLRLWLPLGALAIITIPRQSIMQLPLPLLSPYNPNKRLARKRT
jgi:hypothetical protein